MAICASLLVAAPAVADPEYYNGSAESVVDRLEADGYNVSINWLNGYDVRSLSVCWVENINNPGDGEPWPGAFTTVYVDVRCPNHDYY
jgi:hypothetical protein